MRWLLSFTRITYLCKLIGTLSFAAVLRLELFWVSICYLLMQVFANTVKSVAVS